MSIEYIEKGKARLRISVGSGESRKKYCKTVTYTKKKDLEKMHREFEDECRRNPLTSTTVSELLTSYIKQGRMLGLSVNTIYGYESSQKRIEAFFGDRILAKDLTTYQVDQFILKMNEKYKPKTIANTIFLLNAAYAKAVKAGQLAHNPCENATLPKRKKQEVKILDAESVMRILDALEEERIDFRVGYELCLMCGLRRGEVLGLREEDFNETFKCISVNKTRYFVDGKEIIQPTKTERSNRTLALPQKLVDDIRELIDEHHDKPYNHSDYLIQDGFGEPLNPSSFSSHIRRTEKRLGIDIVSVHGLRHTFTSMLINAGVDIAQVSAELGHSNITTTLNTYTHIYNGVSSSSRGIANVVENALEKPAPSMPHLDIKKTAEA